MRKVSGEDITVRQLKESYFGYNDDASFDKIVELIECRNFRYVVNEDGDAFIRYPIYIDDDSVMMADYSKLDETEIGNISVYDFIRDWWGLYDYDIEEFTFYFAG